MNTIKNTNRLFKRLVRRLDRCIGSEDTSHVLGEMRVLENPRCHRSLRMAAALGIAQLHGRSVEDVLSDFAFGARGSGVSETGAPGITTLARAA